MVLRAWYDDGCSGRERVGICAEEEKGGDGYDFTVFRLWCGVLLVLEGLVGAGMECWFESWR